MNLRRRVARRLGYLADRLAPEDASRRTSICFEFITHQGIVTNTEGRGCPLWYQGREDYEKAHATQTAIDNMRSAEVNEWLRNLARQVESRPPPWSSWSS